MTRKIFMVLSLALLLSGTALAKGVTGISVTELSKTSSSWNGNPLPNYPSGTPEVTILRIVIPPGAELPLHMHPVINAGVMIRGELTVVTENGNTLHLNAGDAIVEVVDTWHYGKNEGDIPAEIIVFYAGVAGGQISVLSETGHPER